VGIDALERQAAGQRAVQLAVQRGVPPHALVPRLKLVLVVVPSITVPSRPSSGSNVSPAGGDHVVLLLNVSIPTLPTSFTRCSLSGLEYRSSAALAPRGSAEELLAVLELGHGLQPDWR